MEKPEGYPEVVSEEDQSMTGSSSWFWGAKDDMSLLESGLLGKCYPREEMDGEDFYYSFQSRVGKFSDPRLLALVEFFRELYFRKRDLLRKIFPQLQDKSLEVLKNSGMRLWRVKSGDNRTRFGTMQRSLSLGSPRSSRVKDIIEPHELRNEWIKVRMINAGDGGGDGGDQQGGPNAGTGQGDDKKSGGTSLK